MRAGGKETASGIACVLRENVDRGGYATLLAGVNVTAQPPANAALVASTRKGTS
jgi:hypothetical protein